MPKVTGKTKHDSNGAVPKVKAGTKVPYAGLPALKSIPPKEPLWRGPELDGVTQTLIGKFLSCRERFRLLVVEGLKEKEGFSNRLEYGNMIHVCEEATAAKKDWQSALLSYAKSLAKKYGNQDSAQISHWYEVCKAQYPHYLKHWKGNPDVKNRQPLWQEKVFDVPYMVPSGRMVRLRGKFDAVDVIGKQLYIQENKARGDIQPDKMLSELPFDFQTNLYLTALDNSPLPKEIDGKVSIGGVRYNVIRRPLSGGKYSIKQHEGKGKEKKGAETPEQFYARLSGLIKDDPEFFFHRWKIEFSQTDIYSFQKKVLHPILENLLDWWEWIKECPFDPWSNLAHRSQRVHWIYPSGVYNPMAEGRVSPYDEFLQTKSDRGLFRATTLFPELEETNA